MNSPSVKLDILCNSIIIPYYSIFLEKKPPPFIKYLTNYISIKKLAFFSYMGNTERSMKLADQIQASRHQLAVHSDNTGWFSMSVVITWKNPRIFIYIPYTDLTKRCKTEQKPERDGSQNQWTETSKRCAFCGSLGKSTNWYRVQPVKTLSY